MQETIGRPKVARAYAWLIALTPLVIVVQGILFGGFYSRTEVDFLDAHGMLGEISGGIILIILTPLAFLARFPRRLGLGWWTLGLGILWNVQAHLFGYGIEDVKWFEMIHIPLAFIIFGIALYLTWSCHKGLASRSA